MSTVKVDPATLTSAADNINELSGSYDQEINKIKKYVGYLSSMWNSGDDARRVCSSFESNVTELGNVKDGLNKIVANLNSISKMYSDTDDTTF